MPQPILSVTFPDGVTLGVGPKGPVTLSIASTSHLCALAQAVASAWNSSAFNL